MAGRFRTAFKDSFRTLHTLTLEVLGAFYLALAVLGGADSVRRYQAWSGDAPGGFASLILALTFTVLTLGLGIHSFWKARRLRR